MLTPQQARHAFVPLIVLTMSAVLSLVMSAINLGIDDHFVGHWLRNWAIAFAVALPTAWVAVPRIQALLAWATREPDARHDEVHP